MKKKIIIIGIIIFSAITINTFFGKTRAVKNLYNIHFETANMVASYTPQENNMIVKVGKNYVKKIKIPKDDVEYIYRIAYIEEKHHYNDPIYVKYRIMLDRVVYKQCPFYKLPYDAW